MKLFQSTTTVASFFPQLRRFRPAFSKLKTHEMYCNLFVVICTALETKEYKVVSHILFKMLDPLNHIKLFHIIER